MELNIEIPGTVPIGTANGDVVRFQNETLVYDRGSEIIMTSNLDLVEGFLIDDEAIDTNLTRVRC